MVSPKSSMRLRLFFWFNCIFGGLPFRFNKENDTSELNYAFIGFICFPVMIWSSYYITISLCSIFNAPGTEPQRFNCILIQIMTILVFLNRFWNLKKTKHLFIYTLTNISESDKFFMNFSMFVVFNFILSVSSILLVFVNFSRRSIPIMFFINQLSGYYPGKAKTFCVATQLIYFCNYVEKSLNKINNSLASDQLEIGLVRNLKMQAQEHCNIFRTSVDVYAVDMFFIIAVIGVDFYVRFNDFYRLTLLTFSSSVLNLKLYISSIMYYKAYILVSNIFIIWLCGVITDLNKVVSRTRTILLHANFSTLQEDAKDELILFLEQLDQTKLVVDAFGFFNVGRKLLFKGFCQVTTFVVLFIQLNKIRSAQ